MGLMPTMIGNGYYYGKCRRCGFESNPFGRSFMNSDEWRLAPISELEQVKCGMYTYYQRKKKED